MSDFVSWCRHLLVPFFFMKWHPYIPLHFIEMIFPLVLLIFHSFFWGIFVFAPRARRFMHAHAHMMHLGVIKAKQRCRDGVMSDFVSWCKRLLVPFFFVK